MKKIVLAICTGIAKVLGVIAAGRIGRGINYVKECSYAAYLSARFKTADGLHVYGSDVHVQGGEHITLGKNVILGFGSRLDALTEWDNPQQSFSPEIKIGENVVVAPYCHISCINRIEIGDYTTMGPGTLITDHVHGDTSKEQLDLPPRHRPLLSKGPVIIGRCVHMGERVTVLPGVKIGDHSVIGANAVVTHDVSPYSVVVGPYGKVVRTVSE